MKAFVMRVKLKGARWRMENEDSTPIPTVIGNAMMTSHIFQGQNVRDAPLIIKNLETPKIALAGSDGQAGIAKNTNGSFRWTNVGEEIPGRKLADGTLIVEEDGGISNDRSVLGKHCSFIKVIVFHNHGMDLFI